MQLCPELLYPVDAQSRAASPMSASAQTIVAAFPPARARRASGAAADAIDAPPLALP
jgi:hypothetical protein